MSKWRRESVLDLYNLLLAAVLFASPWLFKLTNGAGKADLSATGAVIAVVSLGAIAAYANWEEWINLLLGVWLIASPWLLGFAHTRAMHVSIALAWWWWYFSQRWSCGCNMTGSTLADRSAIRSRRPRGRINIKRERQRRERRLPVARTSCIPTCAR